MSEAGTRVNLPEYSVSELSASLKRTVEDAFPFVRVRGEVSKVAFQSSGHVYFALKDDKAVLDAVCWRTSAQRLKVKPQQGLEVVCTGRISTYAGSGGSRYQIIVEQVELAGLGALMALLEERKKKLAAEGLFVAERKRKLPFLPDVIGVVTTYTFDGTTLTAAPTHVTLGPGMSVTNTLTDPLGSFIGLQGLSLLHLKQRWVEATSVEVFDRYRGG